MSTVGSSSKFVSLASGIDEGSGVSLEVASGLVLSKGDVVGNVGTVEMEIKDVVADSGLEAGGDARARFEFLFSSSSLSSSCILRRLRPVKLSGDGERDGE